MNTSTIGKVVIQIVFLFSISTLSSFIRNQGVDENTAVDPASVMAKRVHTSVRDGIVRFVWIGKSIDAIRGFKVNKMDESSRRIIETHFIRASDATQAEIEYVMIEKRDPKHRFVYEFIQLSKDGEELALGNQIL